MRIAIVGSRNYSHPEDIDAAIEFFQEMAPGWTLVSGGARGVDTWAQKKAEELKVPVEIHEAMWDELGKSAGILRNKCIVESSNLVVAFWDGKSRGTKFTIDYAKKLGVECWVIQGDEFDS